MNLLAMRQQIQNAPLHQQALQQQVESGNVALQLQHQDLQDQQTTRSMLPKLLAENGGDWEKAAQSLTPHVSPKMAFGLQSMFLGNAEKRAQIQKSVADAAQANASVAQKERDYLGNLALGVQKSGYSPALFDAALEHAGQLNPSYKDHIAQIRQNIQQNPDTLKQIIDGLVSGSEVATKEGREQGADKRAQEEFDLKKPVLEADAATKQQEMIAREIDAVTDQTGYMKLLQKYPKAGGSLPAVYSPEAVQAAKRMAVPVKDQPNWDIDTYKSKMGLIGNSEYDQFLAQYARSLGKSPVQLTPQEGLSSFQKFAELKQDPTMRSLAISQKQLAETMARTQLAQMPTDQDYDTLAKSLIDKSLSPTQFNELKAGRMGQVSPSKVFLRAKQMDPAFSIAKAEAEFKTYEATEKAFAEGKEATLSRSISNALEHTGLLEQARIAMNNSDLPAMAAVANWFGVQAGSDLKTTYDMIAKKVGDEWEKAFVPGGGGQAERQLSGADFSSAKGDAQIKANIRAAIHLGDSQIRNLQAQYKRGTYGQGGQQLITPEAMTVRDRILGGGSAPAAGGGQPQAAPAAPKKDDKQTYQGHDYVFDGSKWVRQ